eukprot:scaffold4034_cov60-Phaeocystis_antarctica.AAC.2
MHARCGARCNTRCAGEHASRVGARTQLQPRRWAKQRSRDIQPGARLLPAADTPGRRATHKHQCGHEYERTSCLR